jgi:hypothetical protein
MVVESSPSTLKYESAVVAAEAHFVIVDGRYSGNGRRPRTILRRGRTRGGRHRPDGAYCSENAVLIPRIKGCHPHTIDVLAAKASE